MAISHKSVSQSSTTWLEENQEQENSHALPQSPSNIRDSGMENAEEYSTHRDSAQIPEFKSDAHSPVGRSRSFTALQVGAQPSKHLINKRSEMAAQEEVIAESRDGIRTDSALVYHKLLHASGSTPSHPSRQAKSKQVTKTYSDDSPSASEAVVPAASLRRPVVGLALSGGGVRCASFASGVLAEFWEQQVLRVDDQQYFNDSSASEFSAGVSDRNSSFTVNSARRSNGHTNQDWNRTQGSTHDMEPDIEHPSRAAGQPKQSIDELYLGSQTHSLQSQDSTHDRHNEAPSKVIMSAVSGGGYTAASWISWLLEYPHDKKYGKTSGNHRIMRNLDYLHEYLAHMHARIGHVFECYNVGVPDQNWKLVTTRVIIDIIVFIVMILGVAILMLVTYAPLLFLSLEFMAVAFGSVLSNDGNGPISPVALVFILLGTATALYVVRSLARSLWGSRWQKPKRRRSAALRRHPMLYVGLLDFLGVMSLIIFEFGAIAFALVVTEATDTLAFNDQESGQPQLFTAGLQLLFLLLYVCAINFAPVGERGGRVLGLLLLFSLLGPILNIRIQQEQRRVFFINIGYSNEVWGILLLIALACTLFHGILVGWHDRWLPQFYRWKLRKALFHRGDTQHSRTWKDELMWYLCWSTPGFEHGSSSEDSKFCCNSCDVEKCGLRKMSLDPQMSSIAPLSVLNRFGEKISVQYISILAVNNWAREIEVYDVVQEGQNKSISGKPGLTHSSPPWGLVTIDAGGYHRIDDSRIPPKRYIREFSACPAGYEDPSDLRLSKAMAISGAAFAYDMGQRSSASRYLSKFRCAFLTLGFGLGWTVWFKRHLKTELRFTMYHCINLLHFIASAVLFVPGFAHAIALMQNETNNEFIGALNTATAFWVTGVLYMVLLAMLAGAAATATSHSEARYMEAQNARKEKASSHMLRRWVGQLRLLIVRYLPEVAQSLPLILSVRAVSGMNEYLTIDRRVFSSRNDDESVLSTNTLPLAQDTLASNSQDQNLSEAAIPNSVYFSDGGHAEELGLIPALVEECDEIFCVDGTEDPSEEAAGLFEALTQARQFLGCRFYFVQRHTEEILERSDIEAALYKYILSDRGKPFRESSIRPWAFTFRVRYKSGKTGIIHYLKARAQTPDQLQHLDRVQNPFRDRNILPGDELDVHEDLYGVCCDCWSQGCFKHCCSAINNCGCGQFPHHNTQLNQCFTSRFMRAYYYQGRQAAQLALQESEKLHQAFSIQTPRDEDSTETSHDSIEIKIGSRQNEAYKRHGISTFHSSQSNLEDDGRWV